MNVPFRYHSEVFSKFFFNSPLSLVVHKIDSCVNLGSTDKTSGCLTTNLKTVLLLYFDLVVA